MTDAGGGWYSAMRPSSLEGLLTEHDARLVDLRRYGKGETVYGVLMVAKSSPGDSSWWYAGLDATAVKAKLASNHATLTSVEPADRAGSSFDVVMSGSPTPGTLLYDNV